MRTFPDSEQTEFDDTSALRRRAIGSAGAGVLLLAVAIVVPHFVEFHFASGISGYERFPPLHGNWLPEFDSRSILPIVVAVATLASWNRIERLRWWVFLATTWIATWLWTFTLAYTDGRDGLGAVYLRDGEYVHDARTVTSIPEMLASFIDHIPIDSPDNWHVHVAGHPPGAFLAFIGFDRIGITDVFWIGTTVMTIGTTAVIGGLLTIRKLGGEDLARKVAPWWVLAPVAIWVGSSGDALFLATSAWGFALLATASTHRGWKLATYGIASGLVLGYCVYLSYGLVLLGFIAVGVLIAARTARALPWALGGALAVAAAFTVAGFAWWEAYPVLRERYYDGIASRRPYEYWVWANIGAWTFTAGFATWAAFPQALRRLRDRNPVAVLGCAALLCIIAATLSGMSKAEVERIWMPFTLWVLALPALLPLRWRTPLLTAQVALALFVQFMLYTRW